ncbi:MerR family transcriptional regulator [Clostridium sp. AM58-1XD]|uniref:MerR family transcriptional regulator n=1 Tax=Clostridium sp. AM58-1XD TaxID=2292307 RepID=UPI000E4E2D88|nr:MerR family transcriptional regulator [Clostridium sp. AM58-1XD]RGZ01759.1 MerR family transcriptional regulator [Clostridium sp. AM58-1XD]
MYTIGQVSEMFQLPISTLRYYDKEGLFPGLTRISGVRKFGENELERLRVIECLKQSGVEIKDIKQFMQWCEQGESTYLLRHDFFMHQKKVMEAEIEQMQKTLSMIRYKCWYYEQAMKDGSENHILEMLPDQLPQEIQALYDHARGK